MMRSLLLATISVFFALTFVSAQTVFDPTDPIVRYQSSAALGSAGKPDPDKLGLQKWVATKTNGVDESWANNFKSYYLNVGTRKMSFRVRFPRSWSDPANANKKYPALLFFHGAGEFGCPDNNGLYNNEKHLLYGARTFNNRVQIGQFDGFLVFPMKQSPDCWGTWPNGQADDYRIINDIMDSLARDVRLDLDRVITTGLSAGGFAAFNHAANWPTRVAKLTPAAATYLSSNLANFIHIPIWFATGGKDTNPSPASAVETNKRIANLGGDGKYTQYPNLGHSVWNELWGEPGYVPFMNDLHKANPLVFFGRSEWCPTDIIAARLGLSDGFAAYEWQKDGVTIARRENNINTVIVNTNITSFTGNEIIVNAFGTYRARFKRYTGSEWSEWSMKPAVIKSKPITQTPPVQVSGLFSKVLPAPDGSTTVPLKLADNFAGYKWYTEPNNELVGESQVFTAGVGEYRGQVVEQYGCGTLFSPVFKVVNANGFPKPEPAKNLVITQSAQTSNKLEWSQNPNAGSNETGFEIYRTTTPGTNYKLIHITNADVTTYTDQNLPINTQYYYVIRAVNNTGASGLSNEATGTTLNDVSAPTAPANVTFRGATQNSVSLKWNASSDDAGIQRYDIYVDDVKMYSTTQTSFTVFGLDSLRNYRLVVKAVDITGNVSAPGNEVTAYTHRQGVAYDYYHGTWSVLPDFNAIAPVKSGVTSQITNGTSFRTRTDLYAIKYSGFIYIPVSGTYIFETNSDDGSKLYINTPYSNGATALVNNDGLHGTQLRSGSVTLTKGYHSFVATYFERDGGDVMELWWSNIAGGITREKVPDGFITYENVTLGPIPAAPSALTATSNGSRKIGLTWNDNSNNETGFEIVRGLTLNGTFTPVATLDANTKTFTDSLLNPSTAYFYRIRSINANGQSEWIAGPLATATTTGLEAGPSVPGNPVAQVISKTAIRYSFTDLSDNETGFEIYRSVANNNTWKLIKTLPAASGGTLQYDDTALYSNTSFYYRVRATGSGNHSAYSAVVNGKTGNTAPVIKDMKDITVRYGSTLTVVAEAMDPDGDVLTISALNLPRFATLEPVGNGVANLVLKPNASDRKSYSMRLIVKDPAGAADTTAFTLVVNTNEAPTLNAISNVSMSEGETLTIPLTANDPNGNAKLYYFFDQLPSFATFTYSGNGKGNLELKPGYGHSGVYDIKASVDDGFGAWTSRRFTVSIMETDPNETLRLNFRNSQQTPVGWNTIQFTPTSPVFNVNNLKTIKNETTSIGISVFKGSYVAALGAQNESGVFPNNVVREGMMWGHIAGAADDTLVLRVSGLNPVKQYDFVFFGNISAANCNPCNTTTATTYRIGDEQASVLFLNNTTRTDTIADVSPDASGDIFIRMYGSAAFNYRAALNALVIHAHAASTEVPAKPLALRGQSLPQGGALLTWEDKAYNESDYLIYRSENRSGTYVKLNTTNYRDSINYLDATAQPLTSYYYYVVGVNRFGTGISSDTINLVTGNYNPKISGGNDLALKADQSGVINFSVSDSPGDILTVTIPNKPAFITLDNLGGGNYRITAEPTSNDIGWHSLDVVVSDNKGGSVTKVMSISVGDKNTRTVYVNLGTGSNAPSPWNNWFGNKDVNHTSPVLRDENNTNTLFRLVSLSKWGGTFTLGHITGNNTGVVPDVVLASGIFDIDAVARKFRFTGLNPEMKYNIALVSSYNEGLTASSEAKSGTEIDVLEARNNTQETANLNGLIPNAAGEIEFEFRKLATRQYLNAVILEEYSPAIAIMSPANLYAEPLNTTSAAISWSDRAIGENQADGYQVQYATNENFTNNLVTVSVAGNVSRYTATGLKPNTRYYFRVRAKVGAAYSEYSNTVQTITPEWQVFVNFNFQVANAPQPWNNLQAFAEEPTTYSNLKDHKGGPTSLSLTFEQLFNGENNAGKRTGNNTGVVPDNVLGGNYWLDKSQVAHIRVSGLQQGKRYRFGFLSSIGKPGWTLEGNYTATYTINGRTAYLNAWENTSKMVYIGDVTPDENGQVLLELSTTEQAIYGFHSAITIEGYTDVIGGTVLNQALINPQTQEAVMLNTELPLENLKMYPNPFVETVNLEFYNTASENRISVDIVDISGRIAYKKEFGTLAQGNNTISLKVKPNKLSKGVYIVTLRVNNKPVQSGKLMRSLK